MDDERKVGGRSFQTRGPETAKLRDPALSFSLSSLPRTVCLVEAINAYAFVVCKLTLLTYLLTCMRTKTVY